jgi:hypothetical protein
MADIFLLFAGDMYYSCGGMGDLVGQYPTLKEALTEAEKRDGLSGCAPDWWHIYKIDGSSRPIKIIAKTCGDFSEPKPTEYRVLSLEEQEHLAWTDYYAYCDYIERRLENDR